MHSRNSCKTLKCPRCNWHYKYQETLEIHMKEKHPENENSCFFCLSNQSHPRLARGETYTCGYKPYRCEVCNYSTTTKGNLSIHMTSDKHMTNIQQYDASAAQMASANKLAAMGVAAAAAAANNNNTRDSTASPSNSSNASANGGQLTNTSSEQASSNNNNQFGADDSIGQQHSLATSISNALALAAAAANNSSSSASSSPTSGLNQQQQNTFITTSSNNINLAQAGGLMTSATQFAPTINSQAKISQEAMNMLRQQLSSTSPAATTSPNAINTTSDPVSGNAGQHDQGQQQQPQQTAAALAAILLAQQNPNALEDYINSQEIAKDSYDDPSRKYKCHRCKVAFTRQSYLTAHNKTLFHRKGEKLAYPMEKYLDPNRPFKCDICKESFTQKSILLVHNNSVSHLNKLRQSKKLQQQQQANSAEQALQQATTNSNDRSTTSTPINTNVNNLITSTPPQNAFGAMSPQVSQALQQHLQSQQQATTSASNGNIPAANALASHLSMLQQQATNPLAAALQADPMSALMAGGNPMAALLMASAGQMSHPIMPFMMNPQLMAAAALAAAHSSRAMLDPQAAAAAAAASMFQQPQLTPKSSAGPCATNNPFLDFQNQQQQLMQQAANQLAAAVASQAGSTVQNNQSDIRASQANSAPACSTAYSLGNLLANQGVSAADFIQQSLAAAGNPLQALMGSPNKLTPDAMMNSAIDSIKNHAINSNSNAHPHAAGTPITSSAPSHNQHHHQQSDQSAAAAAAAAAALSVQQQKRARTRISEDQLRILRQYFDINNSPTEEQLQEMSVKSELPLKVIKHWFRNTLFKERQKNKDSPYNFNNPPMLALNLEEYERTGEAKVTPISDLVSQSMNQDQVDVAAAATTILNSLNNLQQQAPNLLINSSVAAAKDEYEFNDSLAPKEDSVEEAAAAVVRDVVDAVASNETGQGEATTPPGGLDASSLKRTRPARNGVDVKRFRSDNNQEQVKKEILDAQQQLADNSNNPYLSQSERLMILFNNLQRQSAPTGANASNLIDQQAGGAPGRDCDSDSAQDSDDSQGSSFSANNNSPDDAKLKQNTGNSKQLQSSRKAAQQQANRQLRRSKRFDQSDALSPVQDENAGIGPSSTWSPLQLQQQLFDQTWATVNNHLNSNSDGANRQGLSSKTSDSSSHSVNSNNSKSKRANRTRFSDQQVKVLQEFFEQNAYPKDDDLECLSKQLGLSPRVIVVWFQNARQKARKVYENRPNSASMSEGEDDQIMSMNHSRLQSQNYSFNTSGTCDSPTSGTGGPHSPSSSMMSNNDHHNHSRARSQQQESLLQQQQLEQFFMNQLDGRGANRNDDDEDEMDSNPQGDNQARASRASVQKRPKREFEDERNNDGDDEIDGEEGDDEHGVRHHNDGEEEEDDDEFMSAAQMMRQQQQQQQQSQQLAAAAAGLFSGDPASLLQQLFAANQQHSGANLFQQQQQPPTDINQRNVMEALSNAMRAAAASTGVGSANTIGGAAANNNAGANNGLMSHLMDGGSQASMISGGGAGANNRHAAPTTNGGLISANSTSSNNTTTTTSTTTSTSSASQRDKRLRTQISPEQLDYLYQKYQVESNPSRKTLESIAQDVGLSKRVVQVWFQNTRARERRGQLRMSHVFAQQQRSQAAAAAAAAAAAVLDLSART